MAKRDGGQDEPVGGSYSFIAAAGSNDQLVLEQIDRFLKGSFTDRQGNFNYKEWVKVLRVNEEDDDAEARA